MLLTDRASTQSKEDLADLCDLHIKLGGGDRSQILYSVKPASQLFHISYDYGNGPVQIEMKPIV